MKGMDLKDSNTSAVPGTKPKPIPKAEHQKMMERRLEGEGGSNCVIANLKAQVGQLEKALKEALEERAGAKVAKEEVKEWLSEIMSRDRDLSHNGADLDSSHQPLDSTTEVSIDPEAEGERLGEKEQGRYQTQAA